MINYYQILGVESDSSAEDIKYAYRKMIRFSHPDTGVNNSSSTHMAQIINEAYKILSNADKKAKYDIQLAKEEENNVNPVPKESQTPRAYTEEKQPVVDYSQPYTTETKRGGDYNDYLYTGTIRKEKKTSYTHNFLDGSTKYLSSFDSKNIFSYLKLSVMSLVELIKHSIHIQGKLAKIVWSAVIGISTVALIMWTGLIGFVITSPDTLIEQVGSSLNVIVWILAWLVISLKSASAGAKLSFKIYNLEHIKTTQSKFGKFVINTQELVSYFMSGIWILIRSAALISLILAVTSKIWLNISDANAIVSTSVTILVAGWFLIVVTGFIYAYEIENQSRLSKK